MNWLTVSAIILGVLIWMSRKARLAPSQGHQKSRRTGIARAEQIQNAISCGTLAELEKLLLDVKSPLDRHLLLSALAKKLYDLRDQPSMRAKFYEYGGIYANEFDVMLPTIKEDREAWEVAAPLFKWLAIAMEEDRRFDEALDLCRKALDWGLDDGTKTGYAGRMNRIKKKQAAA